MESKIIQIEFKPDGTTELTSFLGDIQVGDVKIFDDVPKRLKFFLEKFPADKTIQAKDEPKK